MKTCAMSFAALLAVVLTAGCAKHKTTPPEAPPIPPANHGNLHERVPYEEMIPPAPAEEVDPDSDSLDESGFPEEFRGPDLYRLVEQEAARDSREDGDRRHRRGRQDDRSHGHG